MKMEIRLTWCAACGRQVPYPLQLCDSCEWETPEAVDEAIQAWNGIMDLLQRPELQNLLGFGHGCGLICKECRERYYGHPEICPIHIAVAEDLYSVVMSWFMQNIDKVEPGQTMKAWSSQLSQFAKLIALYNIELLLNRRDEDAKIEKVENRKKN